MIEIIFVLLQISLVNHIVLSHLIGLELQLKSNYRIDVVWLTGAFTTVCLCLSLPNAYLAHEYLITTFNLQYLKLLIDMLLIFLGAMASCYLLRWLFPEYVIAIDTLLPIMLMNSFLIGTVLLILPQVDSFFDSLGTAIAIGIGFSFLLLISYHWRTRIIETHVPRIARNLPIMLVNYAIFSIGISGLA